MGVKEATDKVAWSGVMKYIAVFALLILAYRTWATWGD